MELIKAVLAGVLVFIVSQYFLKLILEPISNFKKLLSDISNTLLINQCNIANAITSNKELPGKISELSAQLRSTIYLIPLYSILSAIKIFGLPKRDNILEACHENDTFELKDLAKSLLNNEVQVSGYFISVE